MGVAAPWAPVGGRRSPVGVRDPPKSWVTGPNLLVKIKFHKKIPLVYTKVYSCVKDKKEKNLL